ncbi:MAG: vitamin K epoxide reductase family protein [Chthoniobacterales bacterium]|nr:vitamin K epoxide reductase family protein [Chthoniobacterales bacterium]
MTPTQLSRELRTGSGNFLEERRSVVALSLTAIGCMGLIAAYQMGLIRRLPDLPLPLMDADKVDASEEAYAHFQMGDAFIGLGSYAATMGLAAMGPKDRAEKQPWIPLALAAKATADAAQAAKLTYDQWAKHKAFCIWCLVAAAATFATVPLVMGEAAAAARHLAKRL